MTLVATQSPIQRVGRRLERERYCLFPDASARRFALPRRVGTAVYDYFLDRLTAARHQAIIARMDAYLASGRPNLWSRGPE